MATKLKEIGGANRTMRPHAEPPRQTRSSRASLCPSPNDASRETNLIPPANAVAEPSATEPVDTPLGGPGPVANLNPDAAQSELADHVKTETHFVGVSQTHSDESQSLCETRPSAALVGNLTMQCRRYEDLRRARQRLLLQAMAACRYACDGDKAAGAKLYGEAVKGGLEAMPWLVPYFAAMDPLDVAIKEQEKVISKLGKQLPVWSWAKDILGLSERFLGLIVGECGGVGPGEYRNPSCLWKRFGMSVADGKREYAKLTGAHVRRSMVWNLGNSMLKAQVRKTEEGERYALGYYGRVYIDRRAYLEARGDEMGIHDNAKRYMEKRLLRELWKAWRAA